MEASHTVTEVAETCCAKVDECKDCWEISGSQSGCKLYERRSHQQDLMDAYHRCMHSSVKELVMINGPSGTGKTALADAFRAYIENQDQAIWIQGKFEQLHRAKPYASFLSALTELVKAIENRGTETMKNVQNALASRLDPDDQLWLASALPSLFQLLPTPTTDDSVASNNTNAAILISGVVARNQFQRVVPILIAAISSAVKTPIVLFLDDLQWSDGASLQLLRDLASERETRSFMVIGACRGDEVCMDHPLSVTLRQLEDKDSVKITNIAISNLHVGAVQEFVSDALKLPMLVVQPLADIVFRESEGNTFYMIRFMQTLQESGFLYQDATSKQWTWDEEQIRPRYDDVLQLLSADIRKLTEQVQQMLQVAACLGSKFKEHHLQIIISSEVEPALATAEEKNIVFVDSESGLCNWVHDRWQQAAYNLITESAKAQFHLQIGRLLWNGLPAEEQGGENLFLIVNQILKGAQLITDDEERQIASVLCLQAGEMAAKASAFEVAALYVDQGLVLLNRRHWRDQYDLSLRLYNAAAEMEYCKGRFDKVIVITGEILWNARSFEDRLQAYTTQVYAFGTKGNIGKSLDIGLSVLKQLGVAFPRNARVWHVIIEFMKTKNVLKGKSDSDILNLPLVSDTRKVAAMNLMNLLFLYAKMTKWNLCAMMALQMVRTTVQEGLTGASCAPCFSFYGSILCWLGDIDEGFRCAQLSLMILKKFNTKEWIPRVAGTVFGVIRPWKVPLRDCLPGLFDAHRLASQSGDFEVRASGACSSRCSFVMLTSFAR
jgi:predicted ATPase